jgi:hypothetical protein
VKRVCPRPPETSKVRRLFPCPPLSHPQAETCARRPKPEVQRYGARNAPKHPGTVSVLSHSTAHHGMSHPRIPRRRVGHRRNRQNPVGMVSKLRCWHRRRLWSTLSRLVNGPACDLGDADPLRRCRRRRRQAGADFKRRRLLRYGSRSARPSPASARTLRLGPPLVAYRLLCPGNLASTDS